MIWRRKTPGLPRVPLPMSKRRNHHELSRARRFFRASSSESPSTKVRVHLESSVRLATSSFLIPIGIGHSCRTYTDLSRMCSTRQSSWPRAFHVLFTEVQLLRTTNRETPERPGRRKLDQPIGRCPYSNAPSRF